MASISQPPSAYSPDTCMFCQQSLRITTGVDTESDPESEHPLESGGAATVIDDVELYCGPPGSGPGGHHAHWTCLIDHAKQARTRGVTSPMLVTGGSPCVVCGQNTLDSSGRFVVDVRNEGGETKGFRGHKTMLIRIGHGLINDDVDRLNSNLHTTGGGWDRSATQEEELFLDSRPSQVHNRAFHDLVAEGDYAGAIELIAEYDIDINCTYGSDSLTALQKALFNGDMSGVEFLRSLGATV
ncbi:hypothetical protein J3R83DRAFT_4064 [Lanmaoa asiatica]|nr:hypothetical protein J3R83DRAFT_4064 [Lanmaoa asiatica]